MSRLAFAVGLAVTLNLLAVTAVVAQERTAVFIVSDVVMPHYDRIVSGQLTVDYDDSSGAGSWSFQGMIDGQLATASGEGEFEATGSDQFRMTITAIDSWKIPGIGGYAPRTATIRTVGALGYVSYQGRELSLSAIPIAFSPKITTPVEGVYTISSAGAGAAGVVTLPNTGVGPATALSTDGNSAMVATGLIMLFGALLLGAWRFRAANRTPMSPI
ncbi:MAG TPA: hypothetical protein PKA95_12675 [Thermomicrobiales bacterium]|nr:hypothetical protein [Thermomicrobiales bacterium]